MYKTILVTGCYGFIGSHLVRELLRQEYNVVGFDKLTYAANLDVKNEFNRHPNYKGIIGDIVDIDDYDLQIGPCSIVINMAAESHVDRSIDDPSIFLKTNVIGTNSLISFCLKRGIPLFHISTDEVYGDGFGKNSSKGHREHLDPLLPSNPYAASKAAAEHIVRAASRTYGLDYLMVRPSNNYGPGQHPEKLIPATISCLKTNQKLKLHDKGQPRRTWLHVQDTVDAIIYIMKNSDFQKIYNISGNIELKNWETVSKIVKNYFELESVSLKDLDKYVDYSYNRPGQDIRYKIDDTNIRMLGWEPKRNFDEELKRIVDELR